MLSGLASGTNRWPAEAVPERDGLQTNPFYSHFPGDGR